MTLQQRIIVADLLCALVVGLVTIPPLGIDGNWLALSCGVASVAFTGLFARPLARWALSPASVIRDSLAKLERGEISRLNAYDGPPEIHSFITRINTAAEKLMARNGHDSVAGADLAHQIRTALQLLGMRIDQLAVHLTDEGLAVLTQTKADVTRLHDLLTEHLDNARSETTPPLVEIDVRDVLVERFNAWSDMASRQGSISLRQVSIDSAVIVTQRGTLEHLLDIFLDNAIRHSPQYGKILLSAKVDQAGNQVAIRVVDQGAGMVDEQRAHATARGWQANAADGPGHGLGLSIADVLVKQNRGLLTLDVAPSGHGLDVCVRFPVVSNLGTLGNVPNTNPTIARGKLDSS
ncbi:HAMP domain-containing sensor histidine kinase [Nocardia sp. NPDC005745]|uniref:sensor histidine kinase n=1 Tax=Nocardia sp. NPDC005745 TaxID=3157061 RepID=UPI0033C60E8D